MRKGYGLLLVALLLSAVAGAADVESLMKGVSDPSADVRAEAWKSAGPLGAEAVAPLAGLLASQDGEVAKSAAQALDNIVDYACRPGATDGKAAVAAELAKLLDAAQPAAVRTGAVRLLALCGGDAEVPAVVALLGDKDLALVEDARMTLQEIPGDAASKALLDALPKVQPQIAQGIATALGQRHAVDAIPALKEQVASGEPTVKWASLAALARLGVPPGEATPRPEGADRVRWDDARLVAAGNCDAAKAVDLLKEAASQSEEDRQVATALLGLMNLSAQGVAATPERVQLAFAALKRPGARSAAVRVLSQKKELQIDAMMADTFGGADPATQAALVEILANRKSEGLGKVLEAAVKSEAPEVRLAAAEYSGEAPSTELLFETVAKGSPWSRRHAAEIALTSAAELEPNDAANAQSIYERIVRSKIDLRLKREALAGLERLARVESLPLLDEYVAPLFDKAAPVSAEAEAFGRAVAADSALFVAAGRAFVAAHAAQGKEAGVPVLQRVLETAPPYDVNELAVEKLAGLGVDPQAPTSANPAGK